MTDYQMVDVYKTPYLYQEKSCSMESDEISKNMGDAFEAVASFIEDAGIEHMGMPLSVYYTYEPDRMTFRAGFMVSPQDLEMAEGDVQGDILPEGRVLHFVHHGPYSKIRDSYGQMMTYLEREGMSVGAPAWEVYLNSPGDVPEEELETAIYVSLRHS